MDLSPALPSSPDETAASRAPSPPRFAHAWRLVVLVVLALAVLTPGISSLPPTDRDEALFIQASRQMLETGNWVDIRFQDVPRYKKPIGIYWLQGLAAEASGQGADAPYWVYRLPSLVGAVLAIVFTYAIGASLGGPTIGLIAGLLAASTFSIGLEARLAKTDAVLFATIVAAQLGLVRAWLDPDRRRVFGRNALFWTAVAVGILIKGPITPLVAGLTIAALCIAERSTKLWRSLAPLPGIGWMLLIDLPWLVAIGWISGGAFFTEAVGHDMMSKIASGQEAHGMPPGAYALMSLAIFWPLVVFVPAGLTWAWRQGRDRRVMFLAAWLVPGWIVFELVATKLPNYVLPFMPPLAILAAFALREGVFDRMGRMPRLFVNHLIVGAALLGIGLNGAFIYLQGRADPLGLVLGIAGVALAVLARTLLLRGRTWAGIGATVVAAGGLLALGFGLLVPAASQLWLSDRLTAAIAEVKPCANPVDIVADYDSPSIVVRLGTATRLVDSSQAPAAFHAARCAVAVIDARRVADFAAAASLLGEPTTPVATVTGRSVDDMRPRTMQIFVKSAAE